MILHVQWMAMIYIEDGIGLTIKLLQRGLEWSDLLTRNLKKTRVFFHYLEEHPKIVPLFKIDVVKAVAPYLPQPDETEAEPDKDAIRELRQAQEVLEQEMAVSHLENWTLV